VTAAIFGLVGVVIGSLASFVVTQLGSALSRRREARVAKRLVAYELEMASIAIFSLSKGPENARALVRGSRDHSGLDLEEWHSFKATLADVLTGNEWDQVRHAARLVRVACDEAVTTGDGNPGAPLERSIADTIASYGDEIDAAADLLNRDAADAARRRSTGPDSL
jgi:hypothetical protein